MRGWAFVASLSFKSAGSRIDHLFFLDPAARRGMMRPVHETPPSCASRRDVWMTPSNPVRSFLSPGPPTRFICRLPLRIPRLTHFATVFFSAAVRNMSSVKLPDACQFYFAVLFSWTWTEPPPVVVFWAMQTAIPTLLAPKTQTS